jgi:hypothetical protein
LHALIGVFAMPRHAANTYGILGLPKPKQRHREVWQLWHLWTVRIPRRSITGELVWGTVLRRLDDNRWIYKKYVDYWDLD